MRNAIRDHIIANVTGIMDVYEPHMADSKTPKPYVVIRQGVDVDEGEWAGFRRIIEVWPYVSKTSFTKVDQLCADIIQALEWKPLTAASGQVFTCVYNGSGTEDVIDKEFDAITRGLQFHVVALQPVSIPETVVSDPWITALSDWTQDLLGDTWAVYGNMLPVGYVRPSVLWRIQNVEVKGISRSGVEIRKEIVGHVLGATPNQQAGTIMTIVQGMMNEFKIPLNRGERTFMTVDKARGSPELDGLNQGQITANLCRKTSRPQEDVPMMMRIEGSGSIHP